MTSKYYKLNIKETLHAFCFPSTSIYLAIYCPSWNVCWFISAYCTGLHTCKGGSLHVSVQCYQISKNCHFVVLLLLYTCYSYAVKTKQNIEHHYKCMLQCSLFLCDDVLQWMYNITFRHICMWVCSPFHCKIGD